MRVKLYFFCITMTTKSYLGNTMLIMSRLAFKKNGLQFSPSNVTFSKFLPFQESIFVLKKSPT